MQMIAGFRLVAGIYWLALGVWVGALVMMAVGAGVAFKTVRHYQPSVNLTPYNQMPEQAVPILAGGVVGNQLKGLAVVQKICALVVVVCLGLQCYVHGGRLSGGVWGWANLARLLLIGLAVGALIADVWVVSDKIWALRDLIFDPSLDAATRQMHRATFDFWHKLDERMVGTSTFALAAAVVISAFVLHPAEGAKP
ncbi:MAG: hypothetical protein IT442_10870 [Phycisphaeraceae bacterium]|nr:hypothetical protein [Phycisphaeraceae bacterium]